ncbi:hypothetical protein BJY00DRAFT_274669 [Aspergillus carlsbadensis]|nr:hypothetical protein BJY00DRAFT_274669 [Aspergillus carlsbadensis]
MDQLNVPNWLRIVLSILTVISFLPQLHAIWRRGSSAGVSVYYVLLNLIWATEQFTLFFFLLINDTEGAGRIVYEPPTTGDWLNLVQALILALMFFLLWVQTGQTSRPTHLLMASSLPSLSTVLYYSPSDLARIKTPALVIYTGFLLISIIPLLLDLVLGDARVSNPPPERVWLLTFFSIPHALIINPVTTLLCFLSLFPQATLVIKRQPSPTLSLLGLAIQSVAFVLVGLSWLCRLNFASPESTFLGWYIVFGWPAVDNLLFATVQATLLCLAMHRRRGLGVAPEPESESDDQPDEAAPLLG